MLWSVRMIHKFWNSYKNVCKNKNSKKKITAIGHENRAKHWKKNNNNHEKRKMN